MKLRKLLKDIHIDAVKGSKEVEITGVCSHSKRISPGNLFIAKKGIKSDGNQFIPEAIAAGATAVITDIFDPTLNVVQVIHSDPGKIEGELAARVHDYPSQKLFTIGITGTNGKTTTSFLAKYLLDALGERSGLIGTIEYIIGDQHYHPTHTTPDVASNHKMLHEMLLHDCTAALMEVTSHAMHQGRCNFIEFDMGVFTNLSHEHLDYHGTIEEYAKCKMELFSGLKENAFAIVNRDSHWHEKFLACTKARPFTYALNQEADLRAIDLYLSTNGSSFEIVYQDQRELCEVPLVGRHNIENVLAAVAICLCRGHELSAILPHLSSLPQVAGRLEKISNQLDIDLYVDFAHTPEALEKALFILDELKRGKVITVFGCGGDRDRTKRPLMAQISERYSDTTIVTSDNPRTEDPEAICNEIIQGLTLKSHHFVEPDRKKAIQKAIELANPGDTILIAGKGHEKTQIYAHRTYEFDDCSIAKEICSEKTGALS